MTAGIGHNSGKKLRLLRDFQDEAVDAILKKPCLALLLDMGFGKTTVFLHAALELPKPILLLGPIRVIETVWEKEASEWAATDELRFSLVRGTPKERKAALEKEADIYTTNRELLEEVLENGPDFQTLMIDESTLYKNPSTKGFKTLRKHLKVFKRRYIATGTPRPNSLMDLWAQYFILDRGERLDTSFSRFKGTFFYTKDWQGYKFEPHDWAEEEILQSVADITFRVEPDALKTLPPFENVIKLDLPEKAREIYTLMEEEAFAELKSAKTITAATAASKLMKLRQLASGFVYDDDERAVQIHNVKVEVTREIVDGTGSPVIVVYQFKHELAALLKEFKEGKEAFVFGRTPVKGNKTDLAKKHETLWNEGKIPVLLLHPQSGGHGLNLQFGGHTMIVFTGTPSYEQMSQVKKRIDRPGQKHPSVYHYLTMVDTVDEWVLSVLETKAETEGRSLKLLMEYMQNAQKVPNDHRGGSGRSRQIDPGEAAERGARSQAGAHRRRMRYARAARGKA